MFFKKRLGFIYEVDKWDKRDFEKSLQSKPSKRKHQNKAKEQVVEDLMRLYILFTSSFYFFLVIIIIIPFEHGRCKNLNPHKQFTSIVQRIGAYTKS